jgi:hypothetical protein
MTRGNTITAFTQHHNQRTIDELLAGYQAFVRQRVDTGWKPYLVTLTFHHLPGKPEAVLAQMRDQAERLFRRLLTRLVRRPRGTDPALLPVFVAAPDLPVGKSHKPLRDVIVNGGVHLHGVLLVPPGSRLRVSVDEHLRCEQTAYLVPAAGRPRVLAAIDVRPIESDIEAVVSYAMKGIARRRFSPDDILVLPRAGSELATIDRKQ